MAVVVEGVVVAVVVVVVALTSPGQVLSMVANRFPSCTGFCPAAPLFMPMPDSGQERAFWDRSALASEARGIDRPPAPRPRKCSSVFFVRISAKCRDAALSFQRLSSVIKAVH